MSEAKKLKWPRFFLTGNIIFVSIYIPLFSIQSTIKNKFPLAKR